MIESEGRGVRSAPSSWARGRNLIDSARLVRKRCPDRRVARRAEGGRYSHGRRVRYEEERAAREALTHSAVALALRRLRPRVQRRRNFSLELRAARSDA